MTNDLVTRLRQADGLAEGGYYEPAAYKALLREAADALETLKTAYREAEADGTALRQRAVLKHGIGYDLVVVPHQLAKVGTRLVLAIRCQTCQRMSFHPKDVRERYCGACHVFHEDRELPGV